MALDPDAFVGRAEFKAAMSDYIEAIKASGPADGVEEILLPGEPEARAEAEYLANEIPIAQATADELEELAGRLGLEIEFD